MERTDTQAQRQLVNGLDSTVYGSLMCQGDSGGPLLINFGLSSKSSPIDQNSPIPGLAPFPNMIVGVTSYGKRGQYYLAEGASPLTSENVVSLLRDVCQDPSNQPACGMQGTIKIVPPDVFPAKWGKVVVVDGCRQGCILE